MGARLLLQQTKQEMFEIRLAAGDVTGPCAPGHRREDASIDTIAMAGLGMLSCVLLCEWATLMRRRQGC